MQGQMRWHPETGKPMRRDIRPATTIDGRTVMLAGWYSEDGQSVHTGADLAVMESRK